MVRIQDYGQITLKWACSLIGKTSASKAVVGCSNHPGPAKQYDAISDGREPRYERGVRVSRVAKPPNVMHHILMSIGNSVHLNMLYKRAVSSVVEQRTPLRKLNWYKRSTHNGEILGSNPRRSTKSRKLKVPFLISDISFDFKIKSWFSFKIEPFHLH